MAHAHHHAARDNERCCCETELLGPKQRCDNHIAPCHQLAVRLHDDPAAQVIEHQCLMRLRQTELPRQARMT